MKNKLLLLLFIIISSIAYSQTTSVNKLRIRRATDGNVNTDQVLLRKSTGLVRQVPSSELITPPQTLSTSPEEGGINLTISSGNTVYIEDQNTPPQTLSINGNDLTISNGNTINLPISSNILGIDDVLSQNQSLTSPRIIDTGGNIFGFRTGSIGGVFYNGTGHTFNATQLNQIGLTTDATSTNPTPISITSASANGTINISTPNGGISINNASKNLLTVSGTTPSPWEYNTDVTANIVDDNDIPNKKYIDDAISLVSGGGSTGLEAIDEGNGIGYRLIGQDPNNYGNIGTRAVDFSFSTTASTTRGATGFESLAFGNNITVSGARALGFGFNGTVISNDGILLGNQGYVEGFSPVAIGFSTEASGDSSIAIGRQARGTSDSSIAIGRLSLSRAVGTIAIGNNAQVGLSISNGIAIGSNAQSTRGSAVALGFNSVANGNNSFALLTGETEGDFSKGLGHESKAFSFYETVLGGFATEYTPVSVVSQSTYQSEDRVLTVGNGQNTTTRSDAFTIYKNGVVQLHPIAKSSITTPQEGGIIIDSEESNKIKIYLNGGWLEFTTVAD